MKHLSIAAQQVLDANYNGRFTQPAPSLYPHQWNWDSGFIALGVAHANWPRAVAEMRQLFKGQWSNGMLPHIIFGDDPAASYFPGPDFWQTKDLANTIGCPPTSGITQPPVHAQVIWQLYQMAPSQDQGLALLEEFFPKLFALHEYLYDHRDPDEEGLIYLRHPWEAGTDNSPYWDRALEHLPIDPHHLPAYERRDLQTEQAALHRPTKADYDRYVFLVDLFRRHRYDDEILTEVCPFQIQDPLFNSILAWSNEALIEIGHQLGEDVLPIILWNELTVHSMNEKLWREELGLYQAYDRVNQEALPVPVISGLLPLIGLIPTQEQAEVILTHLESSAFGAKDGQLYSCPSYALTAKDVDFARYWRGPVWINTNWLLYHGLQRYDMVDLAAKIRKDSLDLLTEFGFYEYFDPRKGAATSGYGTSQFSWSAALCLDWLEEIAREEQE